MNVVSEALREGGPGRMEASVKILELDIGRLRIGPRGVERFRAPLDHDELLVFRDALLKGCFGGLAAMLPERKEEVDLALVSVLEFLREAMALFYAQAVIRHARADRITKFSIPDGFELLRATAAGEPVSPRRRRTWRLLARGIPDPLWRRPLRVARNLLLRDEFSRRPLATIDLQRAIVTPAISPLIRRHVRCVGERVCLVPSRVWFKPLSQAGIEGAAEHALAAEVMAVLIDGVAAAYVAAGEVFLEGDGDYLQRWLQEVSGLCRLYLRRLLADPRRVPARLWTGTGGIIWMRLLRLACQQLGGEVTGHEHGTASGQTTSVNLGLWEFEFCDRFVTFTEELAGYLCQPRHQRYRLSQPQPVIEAITELEGKTGNAPQGSNIVKAGAGRLRRVMYINTIYFGESPGITPAFPDVVWVDWQARLMGLLRSVGFEILLKPHPECRLRPAAEFHRLADKVLWDHFEAVQNQADVYLFDWPQTTTLVQAMHTNRPIVIVDFGFTVLAPEADARLRRRCAVVLGRVDEQGRAQVDFDELRRAFNEAAGKIGNHEYYLHYQGGMQGV